MTGITIDGCAIEIEPIDAMQSIARDLVHDMTVAESRTWITRLFSSCGVEDKKIGLIMRCSGKTVKRDRKGSCVDVGRVIRDRGEDH